MGFELLCSFREGDVQKDDGFGRLVGIEFECKTGFGHSWSLVLVRKRAYDDVNAIGFTGSWGPSA